MEVSFISDYTLNLETVEKFNRMLRDEIPQFRSMLQIDNITVLIDTNIVLQDIIYTCRKNRRTALLEMLVQGNIKVLAPEKLEREVNKHLPRIITEKELNQNDASSVWNKFKKNLNWFEVEMNDEKDSELLTELRDVNDREFIKMYEKINPDFFVSKDKDITDLGVTPKDSMETLLDLRDYSRNKEIAFYYIHQGQLIIAGTIVTVDLVINFIGWLIKKFFELPKEVQLIVCITLSTIFLMPKSRKWLKENSNKLWNKIKNVLNQLSESKQEKLQEHLSTFISAVQSAAVQEKELQNKNIKLKDLNDSIVYVLSKSPWPLQKDEIIKKIKNSSNCEVDLENISKRVEKILFNNDIFEKKEDGWFLAGDI